MLQTDICGTNYSKFLQDLPSVLWSPIPSPQQYADCHFRFMIVLSCGPNLPTDNNISAPATFSTKETARKRNSSGLMTLQTTPSKSPALPMLMPQQEVNACLHLALPPPPIQCRASFLHQSLPTRGSRTASTPQHPRAAPWVSCHPIDNFPGRYHLPRQKPW